MKKIISPEDELSISIELSTCRAARMSHAKLKKHIKEKFPGVPVIVNKNYGFEVIKSEDKA